MKLESLQSSRILITVEPCAHYVLTFYELNLTIKSICVVELFSHGCVASHLSPWEGLLGNELVIFWVSLRKNGIVYVVSITHKERDF